MPLRPFYTSLRQRSWTRCKHLRRVAFGSQHFRILGVAHAAGEMAATNTGAAGQHGRSALFGAKPRR